MSDYDGSRRNQYFVPGDGISREVIQADICKYLDNDATVRPQNYQACFPYLVRPLRASTNYCVGKGRDGYMIYAYRNLTTVRAPPLQPLRSSALSADTPPSCTLGHD